MSDLIIDEARFALGSFDTEFRYVRQTFDTDNLTFWMTQGPTIRIATATDRCSWRFECGPLTAYSYLLDLTPPSLGFADNRAVAL